MHSLSLIVSQVVHCSTLKSWNEKWTDKKKHLRKASLKNPEHYIAPSFASCLQVAIKLFASWWQVRWLTINLPGWYLTPRVPWILTSIIGYQHLRALWLLATIPCLTALQPQIVVQVAVLARSGPSSAHYFCLWPIAYHKISSRGLHSPDWLCQKSKSTYTSPSADSDKSGPCWL